MPENKFSSKKKKMSPGNNIKRLFTGHESESFLMWRLRLLSGPPRMGLQQIE